MPPLVRAPSYAIRKKDNTLYTFEDYLKDKTIDEEQADILRKAILDKKNILVAGGGGAGKTTFLNALINEVYLLQPDQRIVTLEDTDELMSSVPNTLDLYTTDNDDMQALLKRTMRAKADRIILGEVRDGTALDMLKAWNTGHRGGFCSLHANSVTECFDRLKDLVAEATVADLSTTIERAINIIVYIEYDSLSNKRSLEIMQFS